MTRTDRLTREQWLDHGLTNLAEIGFTALKADRLAKSLGVSRGSFYWHFKNLAAFHAAVLGRWQELAVSGPIAGLEGGGDSAENKLHQLLQIAINHDPSLEQAMRAWGYNNAAVQAAITQIDTQRLAYVQQLLEEIGLEAGTAQVRAHLIYAGYLGQIMLGPAFLIANPAHLIEEIMRVAGG